ncbi:MAG: cytochrome bc complex cytochrome b subunit [Sulfuritalea sp.]|jgi:ubiquinol-cytochrome c reductase cytochrome b subunit|nr:cytochrome bc complex cytochrome b subunit [Sulfuritalea sp.]
MTAVLQGTLNWVDERFPLTSFWKDHLVGYYAPKNFNFWYLFGSLAMLVLGIQFVTGILLTMHFKPDASLNASGVPVSFASVEYIMRDVPWGWLIRYMHSTGASFFFAAVYLHIFRGMLYGSYRKPRELIWVFGMLIFFLLMAEAFFGYLLPWGQMSFWGAQVIVNLFSTIPLIGEDLSLWLRGDYVVGDATLNRFFAFHVIAVPLVLLGLVVAHLIALHQVGSNNPDGIEIKKNKDANGIPLDGIPFHPYYTVKDIVGVVVFLMVFSVIIFFMPEFGGYFLEYNNFFPADPMVTPAHIAPVWYFTPYYSILRAVTYPLFGIDAKFWGVMAMGAATMVIALLPWLDRSPVKSIRYRGPLYKGFLAAFIASFLILGYLGTMGQTPVRTIVAQICSMIYFAFFLLMPIYSSLDKCQPEPDRVTSK